MSMRTFSLIWSGIGCFATVAITVLGWVVFVDRNRARAEDEDIPSRSVEVLIFFTIIANDPPSGRRYLLKFYDFVEPYEFASAYIENNGNYYVCGSLPLSFSVALNHGRKFLPAAPVYGLLNGVWSFDYGPSLGIYSPQLYGSYDISYSDNNKTATITNTEQGAVFNNMNGSVLYYSDGSRERIHATYSSSVHFQIYGVDGIEEHEITSHISMEE